MTNQDEPHAPMDRIAAAENTRDSLRAGGGVSRCFEAIDTIKALELQLDARLRPAGDSSP